MLLPEIILKRILDELLEKITSDYNSNVANGHEEDSFLYRVFNGNVLGDYDFFEQSKNVFLRTSTNPRKVETRLMFDRTRAELPTIHVVLPSETRGKDNSLGVGRDDTRTIERLDGRAQHLYIRSFDTNYQVAITSSNPLETVLIYQGLRAGIIAVMDSFEINGLRLPDLSGNDLNINGELMPNVYMRAITIGVDYDFEVPSMIKHNIVQDITFNKPNINGNG